MKKDEMNNKISEKPGADSARLRQLGIMPSTCMLPPGPWETLLDCLCDHFRKIDRSEWLDRFARGLVLDTEQRPLSAATAHRAGLKIFYYREIKHEKPIPVEETILYQDEHLLVADKPHFLPVIPAGDYVSQTLLARLIARTGNCDLQPLHRIDRHTAGLVLFSTNKQTRGLYQTLFLNRRISKSYEALAPPLPQLEFPYERSSRIVRGEPFFLSREIAGEINAHTRIEVIEKRTNLWHYALEPITGKKHQLRLHMAALGAPIINDFFYPMIDNANLDNLDRPLQLLARKLSFKDPLCETERHFKSQLRLFWE
jgi:tRNA pseudouridine32 synthase/23S rRNA pseudouridine746 synthase